MTFLMEHIEKIGLGLAAFVALMLIFFGFQSRQGIESTRSPESLKQEITQTTGHIESFNWERDFKQERAQDDDLLNRAGETLRQVKVDEYALDQFIKPPYHAPRKMRTDPEVYAATEVEARAGWGILAKRSRRGRGGSIFNQGRPDEEEKGRPIPNEGGYRGGEGSATGESESAEGTHFVAVTALVPYRKQVKDYFDRFKTADGFNPSRDFPRYLDWKLERAEVVPGAELQWKNVADQNQMYNEYRRWDRSAMPEDTIDPQSDLPQLTSPLPPISGTSLAEIARHSKIPSLQDAMRRDDDDDDDDSRDWQGDGGPMEGPRQGEWEIRPDFRGGREGGRRDGDGRDSRFFGGDRQGGRFEGRRGAPRDGEFGRGGPQMFEQGFTEDFDPQRLPEHAMFRYFDFDVEVGKTYQYRLQLVLEDPNSPRNEQLDPEASSLDEEVLVRLAAREKRDYQNETEVSPPSPPVTVYSGQRMVLGPVTPAREVNVAGSNLSYVRATTPPKAEVIVVEFDEARVAELPLEVDVIPGSVGYAKGKVEPVYRWKSWLGEPEENKPVRVNSVVVDIRGGESITPKNKGDLTNPGAILVWDAAKRRMSVHRELAESQEYPTFIFPSESQMDRMGEGDRPIEGGREGRRPRRGEGGMEGGTGDAPAGDLRNRRRGRIPG